MPLDFAVPTVTPEEQDQRYRELLDFNLRTTVGLYDKVGRRNPKWDENARAALEATSRVFAGTPYHTGATFDKVYPFAKAAVDAGCDDPLIAYLYARCVPVVRGDKKFTAEDDRRIIDAAKAMEKSAYPAWRIDVALHYAIAAALRGSLETPEQRKEIERMLEPSLALLHKSCREDEKHYQVKRLRLEHAANLLTWKRRLGNEQMDDGLEALAWLEAKLAGTPELDTVRWEARGSFYRNFAWQARGSGFADTVTEEGWRLFGERLQESRRCLQKAWEADPENGFAAASMITAIKGLDGDYDDAKLWFIRAMKADPRNLLACQNMLDYLDPKWHGTHEEMLAFGRSCRDSGNVGSGITTLIADAHVRAITQLPREVQYEYLRSDEIWKEIKDAFDEHFARVKQDFPEHCRFAVFSYHAGKFQLAREHFTIVGDRLHATQIFSLAHIQEIRAQVMR